MIKFSLKDESVCALHTDINIYTVITHTTIEGFVQDEGLEKFLGDDKTISD